jgi:NADPH:quinone reductase-like Zn-dependent oxidoreductase
MKAAVIYENGSPDVLPDPECPDGRVLIDVEAISIEGGDLLARDGSPPPSVPHIVGYLAAGTVVAVAAGVPDRGRSITRTGRPDGIAGPRSGPRCHRGPPSTAQLTATPTRKPRTSEASENGHGWA